VEKKSFTTTSWANTEVHKFFFFGSKTEDLAAHLPLPSPWYHLEGSLGGGMEELFEWSRIGVVVFMRCDKYLLLMRLLFFAISAF
jgi:hypothetical protein